MQSSPLLGRGDELARVVRTLESARVGRAGFAIVEGEPGIGKSRLVAEAAGEAERKGFAVFVGRSDPLDTSRPFAAIADALELQGIDEGFPGAETAELLEAHAALGPDASLLRYRVMDVLLDGVAKSVAERPTLVAIEDLHWADLGTLLVVRAIAARLRHEPIALVCTTRPTPRSLELDRVLEAMSDAGADRVVLGPIGETAVLDLVRDSLGAPPGPRLTAHVRGAAGNPLYVRELCHSLQIEGAITIADGLADIEELGIPPSLRVTIMRGLHALSEDTLATLRIASVMGTAFPLSDLAAVLDRPVAAVLAQVEEAISARVLALDDDGLRFRHDIVRSALYEDIPDAARFALHRDAARRLEAAGAPPDRVAPHILRGARPHDEGAIETLHRAGRDLRGRAPEVSIELLERALDLVPPGDLVSDTILADLAHPLLHVGRVNEARARITQALARPLPAHVRSRLSTALAHALMGCGEYAQAIWVADEAMDDATIDRETRVELLLIKSASALNVGDVPTSETALREASDTAAGTTSVWRVELYRCAHLNQRGRPTEAEQVCRQALRSQAAVADQLDPILARTGRAVLLRMGAWIALAQCRWEEARTLAAEARELFEAASAYGDVAGCMAVVPSVAFATGSWDEVVEAALESDEIRQMMGLEPASSDILFFIALHRNDRTEALRQLGRMRALGDDGAEHTAYRLWAEALVEPLLPEEAAARMKRAGELWGTPRCLPSEDLRVLLDGGERDAAEEGVRWFERQVMPELVAAAMHVRGIIDDDAAPILEAVEQFRKLRHAVWLADAACDAATLLAHSGAVMDAEALFAESLEGFERMGAHRDVARVLAVMRSFGLRRRRSARRAPSVNGWGALTPTEREVVRLVLEHLTNPQIGERLFISKRTVQTHLAHVFAKLGVAGRDELRVVARDRLDRGLDI